MHIQHLFFLLALQEPAPLPSQPVPAAPEATAPAAETTPPVPETNTPAETNTLPAETNGNAEALEELEASSAPASTAPSAGPAAPSTPPARSVLDLEEDEPAEARPGWLAGLITGGAGSLGLLAWLPAGAVCCTSAAIMGAVYPLSRGSPVYEERWASWCTLGVFVGMGGWVLALGGSLVGTAATALGLVIGAGGSGFLDGSRALRIAAPAVVAGAAAAVVFPLAFIAAGLSGFLPWLTVLTWTAVTTSNNSPVPGGGGWIYARWFALNALFMGAVVTGLGLLAVSALTPLGAGFAGWLGARFAIGRE